MSQISEEIRSYIADNFFQGKNDELESDTPLLSSGIIDSISALQLVEFLEDKYGFEFEAHEVDQDNLNSVEIITKFVTSKI